MIRIDPTNWTADFRLARALAEGYHASGLDDVVFFCFGDPEDPIGRLAVLVADETIKYYPNVLGTSEDPVTDRNFSEKAEQLAGLYEGKYVIGIEAGYGIAAHLGSIEITDRPLSPVAPGMHVNDVTVNVVLRLRESIRGEGAGGRRELSPGMAAALQEVGSDEKAYGRSKFKPLRPEQIDRYRVQQLADKVIDGILRFLSRIQKQPL